jgi:transposase
MGAAFQKAARDNLLWAATVFDRFQAVKLMNDRVDQLRRNVFNIATAERKNIIKGNATSFDRIRRTSTTPTTRGRGSNGG